MRTTTYPDLIQIAADLTSDLSPEDSNPEYERGISELIGDAFPIIGMTLGERAEQVLDDIHTVRAGL